MAVSLGVGLLLTAVAATNAAVTWNNRHAWYWTGTSSEPAGPATAGIAPLWWHPSGDLYDGQTIDRFDVAATGASSPVPPGIPRDPAPGQYYASPALIALLRGVPANQLADRFPGRLAGAIGDAALPSPASLVVIVGRTAAQLAHAPDSVRVTSIAKALPGYQTECVAKAARPSATAKAAGRRRTPGGWPTSLSTREAGRTPSTSSCPSWRWPSCSRC